MQNYSKYDLDEYLKNDWIKELMDQVKTDEEDEIRTNKWLYEIKPKRMIYADVYGDLLRQGGKKVLDVGGGINALTKILAMKNEYTLLDFVAHGGERYAEILSRDYGVKWLSKDWYSVDDIGQYDVIVANDIFPDVDQRMELFIDRMLKHCKELRLVITYYNRPVFYTSKRIDDSEILTFLSWDGEITAMKLKKYIDRAIDTTEEDIDFIQTSRESLYRNGRGICSICFNGDI